MPSHSLVGTRHGHIHSRFTFYAMRHLSFICCLLLPAFLWAQPKPMKWGEIPRADLTMKKYPADSNAAAVILADYGEVHFEGEFEMVFTRHRRIKILSEKGYDWGSFSIRFIAENRAQAVSELEGQTFKLAADGTIRQDQLDKKSIFDEDVDGSSRRVRFTMPALAPGCVIEYRYKIRSKSARYLHDWAFQTSEPARWSEFRVAIPSVLRYVIVKQNLPALAVEETTTDSWPINLFGHEHSKVHRMLIVHHRWAMRDVPALRDEPFTTTLDDYRAEINFQLARFEWPWQRPEDVMNSWEKLAEALMESPSFGGQIGRHGILRQQAETVTAGIIDPEKKMRAIYDYARQTMAWDGTRGIYANDLDKTFQARRGGGPEIALMLTSMLRAAGLEAHPVLISTRDNGKIIEAYSILRQFNHVLAYVKTGEKEYLLDATDPLRPYNLLPVAALTNVGFLIEKKMPRWVDIGTNEMGSNQITVSAQLAADGKITGWLQASDAGYSGLLQRRNLKEKKEDEFIRNAWLADLMGAKLDSFKISQKDSTHLPFISKVSFSTFDQAQAAGDNIYFNPLFFNREEENPFKQPERTFPVDFGYGSKRVYSLNLTLPEGYTAQELPKNMALALPNDGGQFRRVIQVEGNHLQLMTQMTIRQPRFEPEEYQALREFYDRLVAAHAEPIVLKRGTNLTNGKE